jgi:hypothetical protein
MEGCDVSDTKKPRKPTFKPAAECPKCKRVENVKSIDGDVATLVKHKRGYYYSTCKSVTVPVSEIGMWIKSMIATRDEVMSRTNDRIERERERHVREVDDIWRADANARDEKEALRKMLQKYPAPDEPVETDAKVSE